MPRLSIIALPLVVGGVAGLASKMRRSDGEEEDSI